MFITPTDVGINAMADAGAGGFRLNLKEFSVSNPIGFTPDPSDTGLTGTELYRGTIESIEALTQSTIKVVVNVPKFYPVSGQWDLTEIALWTDAGILFAHGKIDPSFPKVSDYGVKIRLYVRAARVADLINITVTNEISLPSAAKIDNLIKPQDSKNNVVAVLDGNDNIQLEENRGLTAVAGVGSPSLAIKYGPGGLNWGFVGWDKIFEGFPSAVSSQSIFTLDARLNGFWLNDNEIVIVTAVAGSSQGESRKCRFNKAANTFTVLENPWTAMTTSVKIEVWRNHASALPSRESAMPPYLVLGVGKNSYSQTIVSVASGKMIAKNYTFLGTGTSSYSIPPANIPTASLIEDNMIVAVNSVMKTIDEYGISGNNIVFSGPITAGDVVSVWAFEEQPSTGHYFNVIENTYPVSGLNYQLPVLPLNKTQVFVYYDGNKILTPDAYTVVGSQLQIAATYNSQPVNLGSEIVVLIYSSVDEAGFKTISVKNKYTTSGTTIEFLSSNPISSPSNVHVIVDGLRLPTSEYDISMDRVILKNALTGAHEVELMNFTFLENIASIVTAGEDSGPEWVDPAGIESQPNKIVPLVFEYTGTSGVTTYPIAQVQNANYIMAFVNMQYQPQGTFLYSGGTSLQFLVAPPNGAEIDIICLTQEESLGEEIDCNVYRINGNGTNTYTLLAGYDPNAIIITLSGAYVHRRDYTYNSGTGQVVFDNVVANGVVIQFWGFLSTPNIGFSTQAHFDVFTLQSGVVDYELSKTIDFEENVLGFIGPVLQEHDKFDIQTNINDQSFFHLINTPTVPQVGQPLYALSLTSRIPVSRLLLRSEAFDSFIRKLDISQDYTDNDPGLVPSTAALTDYRNTVTSALNLKMNAADKSDNYLLNNSAIVATTKATADLKLYVDFLNSILVATKGGIDDNSVNSTYEFADHSFKIKFGVVALAVGPGLNEYQDGYTPFPVAFDSACYVVIPQVMNFDPAGIAYNYPAIINLRGAPTRFGFDWKFTNDLPPNPTHQGTYQFAYIALGI